MSKLDDFKGFRKRWLRVSPWLGLYVISVGIAFTFIPVFGEWYRSGGHFADAVNKELWTGRRTSFSWPQLIFLFVAWVSLIWYTYLSGAKRVRDADKLFVFLMFFASGVDALVTFFWRVWHSP